MRRIMRGPWIDNTPVAESAAEPPQPPPFPTGRARPAPAPQPACSTAASSSRSSRDPRPSSASGRGGTSWRTAPCPPCSPSVRCHVARCSRVTCQHLHARCDVTCHHADVSRVTITIGWPFIGIKTSRGLVQWALASGGRRHLLMWWGWKDKTV